MIENNEPVTLNNIYTQDKDTGLLLVAYPEEDKITEFEYTMKLEVTGTKRPVEPVTPTEPEPTTPPKEDETETEPDVEVKPTT